MVDTYLAQVLRCAYISVAVFGGSRYRDFNHRLDRAAAAFAELAREK
jgi:hypothetical protein